MLIPRDVAQSVELAIETQDVMYGSYHVVAGQRGFPIRLEADCRGTWLSPRTQLARNSREQRLGSTSKYDSIQSTPVGAVFNRTGLVCLIKSKIHYNPR